MAIEFPCAKCGKLLRVADDAAGRQAQCPNCSSLTVVPAAPSVFAPPPPAPVSVNPYLSPGADVPRIDTSAAPKGDIVPTVIDFGELISASWEQFQKLWLLAIVAFVIMFVAQMGVSFAISFARGVVSALLRSRELDLVLVIVTQLASLLIQTLFTLVQTRAYLKAVRRGQFDLQDLFAPGPFLLRAIGAQLIVAIAAAVLVGFPVGLGAGLGFAAGQRDEGLVIGLIGGGVIGTLALFYMFLVYGQYLYCLVDQDLGVFDSFRASAKITVGNRLTLFLMFLVSFVIQLVGVLACCVGVLATSAFLFVTMTVTYLMMSGQYQQIKMNQGTPATSASAS